MLRAASRLCVLQIRTGTLGFVYLAAILNLVARALAGQRPEPAAVIQGSVTPMLSRLSVEIASPVRGGAADQNAVAAFVIDARRETIRLLSAALGEERFRELRTRGAAMNDIQACTFARTHIDEYLATK